MEKVMFSHPRLTIMVFLRFILNANHASKQQRIHLSSMPCLMSVVPNNKVSSAYCKFINLIDFDPLIPLRSFTSLAFVIILLNPLATRTNNKGESPSVANLVCIPFSYFELRSLVCGILQRLANILSPRSNRSQIPCALGPLTGNPSLRYHWPSRSLTLISTCLLGLTWCTISLASVTPSSILRPLIKPDW